MNKNPEFLLIGGTGFIGQALSRFIVTKGHGITITGRKPHFQPKPRTNYLKFDDSQRDFASLSHVITANTVIVYLLPVITAPINEGTDSDFFRDLTFLHNFLDWLGQRSYAKLLFLSSGGGIYGNVPSLLPIPEDHECRPVSYNGYKKLLLEKTVQYFMDVRNCHAVIVRPSNPYGPGQQPFRGQGLISTMIAAARDSRTLTLFGSEIVRDYIFIDDLAEGIYLVAINPNRYPVYNIGFGGGLSNQDILRAVLTICDEKQISLEYSVQPPRIQDAAYNVLNTERMKAEYNWVPKIPFSEGLRQTWEAMIGSQTKA